MKRPICPGVVAIAFALGASLMPCTLAAQTQRPVGLDDLAKLKGVGDPQVSPDGGWVAYTVGTVDIEKDKRDTDLWMVSWDGRQQIRLTATADSRSLFFTVVDGRVSYVSKIAVAGGHVEKLTSGKQIVSNIARRDDTTFALLLTTTTSAEEAYAFENGALRRLTHQNDALFSELQLGTTEDFT